MAYFTEPQQALDYIYNLIDANKGPLGIKFVGYADETLKPEYPAVVVAYNTPVDREIKATSRTFRLYWSILLTVYHARLTASHKVRTREDMELAAGVRELLHTDYHMGGGVIFGFVDSERPGIVADMNGQATIATGLVWTAESRSSF